VRITVEAAGLNFIDTYQRSGLYAVPLPFTLGAEIAGVVSAVGANVTGFAVGDRVATAKATGGYAAEALAPAAHLVKIPEGVTTQTAAALMLQGLTAHYLAVDTFPLKPGHTALIHAAAGGVGLLLVQLAKRAGTRVIATVGTDEKVALARGAGADDVVVYTRDNFTTAARAFTGGRGVDVVYDAVGKNTFAGSIDSLRPRGTFVSFGNASGPVPPFAPLLLMQKGSLFFTRPTLAHYTQTTAELRAPHRRSFQRRPRRRVARAHRRDVPAHGRGGRTPRARKPRHHGQSVAASLAFDQTGIATDQPAGGLQPVVRPRQEARHPA